MRCSLWSLTLLSLLVFSASALETIPEDKERQIFAAAPEKSFVKPKQPRRVLIWNTPPHLMEKDPHKGYCIPYGAVALETLGRKTGAFSTLVSDDLTVFLPEHIRQFDAIILNNASGPWITPTPKDLQKPDFRRYADPGTLEQALRSSFTSYVNGGGGIVCLHYAIAANTHWPEFKELLGATFLGHPWNEEIGLRNEEPDHPLVKEFGQHTRVADEIYEYGPPYNRQNLRILLSLDPARSNMGVPWIHRTDADFALAWVKTAGKGRIFNTSFGHRTEIFWNPAVLQLYLDAIQFATGDLQAPAAPREDHPQRNIRGTQPAPGLPEFVQLFNGHDLSGWSGDERIWTVRDGAIVGETTPDHIVTENTFLIWKDEVQDFELRLKYKLENGNSGIYFRASKRPPGKKNGEALVGIQADMSADGRWTGVLMEYTTREVLAERGESVAIAEGGKKQVVRTFGDPTVLLAKANQEWNEYRIDARGRNIRLTINDTLMSEVDDRDPKRVVRGWLGLQLHTGPFMRVQFKDVFLKRL